MIFAGRAREHLTSRFDGTLAHLLLQLVSFSVSLVGPGHELLRGRLTVSCLPVGRVELAQITRDTLLELGRRRSIFPA